jgi:hypothetical protein
MIKEKTQLTQGILDDIMSVEAEYDFNPADFSSDMDAEIYTEEGLFIEFKVGVIKYVVVFDVEHTWNNVHNGGDGWNNPSEYEVTNKYTEITITDMFTEDDEVDVDFEELGGKLNSYICGKYID